MLQHVDTVRHQERDIRGICGVWVRWTNLQRAERNLAKVHRMEGRQWQHRIQDELWEACRHNKSAETWRLSRLLAGTQMGAKRRRLNVPAAETPTVREWAQQLMTQGPDGGCDGEQVRVGPTSDIPPERSGLMHATGTNRKGWPSAPWRQMTTRGQDMRTSRDTDECKIHFLRTGPEWRQTNEEQREERTRATIKQTPNSRAAWEKPRRNASESRYQDGDRKRFEIRRIKKVIRRMKYRKAVPRGSSTK